MSHDDHSKSPREALNDSIPPGADAVEPRDPHHQPVPRRRSKALLYGIPALLLVLIGLGWMVSTEVVRDDRAGAGDVTGTSGERADAETSRGETLNPPQGPLVVSDPSLIEGDDYAGRTARFSAVPVADRNGDRTFWIGRFGNRTLVLLDENAQLPDFIQSGEVIRLAGRIEKAPSSEQLDRLGLSGDDRDAFDGEEVYIRATEVQPIGQDVGAGQAEIPREERGGGQ